MAQPLQALLDHHCLLLVGEPGIGKSTTLEHEQAALQQHCQAAGAEFVPLIDLRAFQSDAFLVSEIFRSAAVERWRTSSHALFLVLDSYDECPLRDSLGPLLVRELKRLGDACRRLHLLLASRPNFWGAGFERELHKLWEEKPGGVAAFQLAPLAEGDIRLAAGLRGVDPDAFFSAVEARDVITLANRPLTLDLLLREFQEQRSLPADRWDLYLDGCRRLVRENNPHRTHAPSLQPKLTAEVRLAIASRIAALTLLSGRESIWRGAPEGDQPWQMPLDALADEEMTLDALREVLDSGLFRGDADAGLARWAHASYGEFLAAHHLVEQLVPSEQIESLLWADPRAGVHPPLAGVALWLAARRPAFLDRLIEVDPWIVIWSDACRTDPALRARLVDVLLRRVDAGQEDDDQFPFASAPFARLAHPGLGRQLQAVLRSPGTSAAGRRFAIRIARESEDSSLNAECLRIATDPAEPAELRWAAMSSLAVLADAGTQEALSRWALSPENEERSLLRAEALLKLWPARVSTLQLLEAPLLQSTVVVAIRERLPAVDLASALRWVETRPPRPLLEAGTHDLENAILERAWKGLDAPGVWDAFIAALCGRLSRAPDTPVPVLKSLFKTEAQFPFQWDERGEDTRWRIIEALVARAESGEGASRLSWPTPALLGGQDLDALAERAAKATAAEERQRWEALRDSILVTRYERCAAFVDRVEGDPALVRFFTGEPVGRLAFTDSFACMLISAESPPPVDWGALPVLRMLDRLPKDLLPRAEQSPEGWINLVQFLRRGAGTFVAGAFGASMVGVLDEHGRFHHPEPVDLLPLAQRFIESVRPLREPWLEGAPVDWISMCAYEALLLIAEDPEALAKLPERAWSTWASMLLTAGPLFERPEHRQALIRMASERAPVEVRRTFRQFLRSRAGAVRLCAFLDRLGGAWTPELLQSAAELIRDPGLDPERTRRLLERVPLGGSSEVAEAVELLLLPGERSPDRRAAAAGAVLLRGGESGWQRIWPLLQQDEALSRRVLELFDPDPSARTLFHPLFALAHSVHRAEVQAWAKRHGHPLSEWDDREPRAQPAPLPRWEPLRPDALRALIDAPWKRVVRTADDLLDVVLESLLRFQKGLHDHTSAIHSLWDETARRSFKPKSEEHLSDALKRHLQLDLAERRAVVNREVVIQPRQPSRPGQRTDLLVDAVVEGRGGAERVSVTIEVKGCWNPELWTAMEEQLAGRYLAGDACRHGIYVVGWFAGPEWSELAPHPSEEAPVTLERARQLMDDQAAQLSAASRRVRAVVLDTAFRAAGAAR